jgi:hypothetical protein
VVLAHLLQPQALLKQVVAVVVVAVANQPRLQVVAVVVVAVANQPRLQVAVVEE